MGQVYTRRASGSDTGLLEVRMQRGPYFPQQTREGYNLIGKKAACRVMILEACLISVATCRKQRAAIIFVSEHALLFIYRRAADSEL